MYVHRQWQAFDTHAEIIAQWNWKDEYAPLSDDATQYVNDPRTRKLFKMPMKLILFDATKYMSPEKWLHRVGGYEDFDKEF
jgi:hypothetical protein